ncbi:TauD/TfdA family dioxygenase [Agrobacterium sp. B1(2019)]|uniref:TauD/TfdA family dioxygenase n=1 Tax=Agrobacterium sp. B1(2019) TaxID=2607032 RepID=UPI0011EF7660|nr:TauD/TfdA family dioxygenase [Agrobacterium sp. B1(2019)]TZG35981.1 TauD/TfdA family dioxygenase [Agrobacterium sp. B1(2019)]
MSLEIRDKIRKSGYIFFSSHRPNDSIIEIAEDLGKPLDPWKDGPVQTLVPRSQAAPNSYGGIFGLNHFPFHSDLAHWRTPPRYLLLRCVVGYADVPTMVIDGHDLIDAVTLDILRRAIFKPRRPRDGSVSLLRLCEPADDVVRVRWDEVFLKPASRVGEVADLRVREWLSTCMPTAVSLAETHDTLLIDNWRMLHARSPILPGRENRAIERVYLEGLH